MAILNLNHQNFELFGLVPMSPTHTCLICVKTLKLDISRLFNLFWTYSMLTNFFDDKMAIFCVKKLILNYCPKVTYPERLHPWYKNHKQFNISKISHLGIFNLSSIVCKEDILSLYLNNLPEGQTLTLS